VVEGLETAVSRVARGSAFLLAGQIISNLMATIAFMFIARGLTKQEMGLASIVYLVSALGTIISGAGIPTSIIRFVSEARGKGHDYRPLVLASLLNQALLASSCSLIIILTSDQLSYVLMGSTSYSSLFYLAALNMVFTGFNVLLNSMLIGLERMDGVCVAYVASAAVACPVATLLVLRGWGVVGYVMMWVLMGSIGSAVSASYLIRALRAGAGKPEGISNSLRALLKFSWPILITNLAYYAFRFFDRFIIVFTGSKEELGMYSVAFKAYTVITMIPLNVAMAVFPYYGERYGREELRAIRQGTILASKYLSIFFVPVALGLAVVAEPVLVFFAGAKYAGSSMILMVLGIFGALTAPAPLLGYLLITYKRTKAYMVANLISVGASLALAPFLISHLGVLMGTALVRGIALLALMALYTAYSRQIAPVDWVSLAKGLTAGFIMASAVYALEFWLSKPIFLPLHIAVGALVYGACIRLLRVLNGRDVVLLSNALPKSIRGLVLALGRLVAFGE